MIGIVELRMNDLTLLQVTGIVPQNVNYALKSSHLLGFLKSVPGMNANLKSPENEDEGSGKPDWLAEAQQCVAVVPVY